jgi:hypothetical protein
MESGFGQNLEGFLIKGNLSLASSELPLQQGDGSIEAAGTLYINNVTEYDVDNGINIQNAIFTKTQLQIPYTQPSVDATSASFVIDGGIAIKNTSNALSITSGGGLTIAGGASIGKNVHIGGILDVHENKIVNVPWPIDGLDAVNKDYIDYHKIKGNFSTGQLIIAESNGDAIRGYNNLRYDESNLFLDAITHIDSTVNSTSASSGALIVQGGIGIGRDLNIDGIITINNTNNITGTVGGSFVCYGGVSISKDVFIGGTVNVNMNRITEVDEPIVPSDAATKFYVDSKTYGNILGNFSPNTVLIGSTEPNSIIGYPTLQFDGETLSLATGGSFIIYNTADTTSLTDNPSFITYGGVNIHKNLFVGGEIDVGLNNIRNVATPIEPYDGVNKAYVDALYANMSNNCCTSGNITESTYEQTFTLDNNVLTPEDIPTFTFNDDIKAFVSYIYVQYNNQDCAVYTIRGLNRGDSWYILPTYVGEPTNVNFFIKNDNGTGIVQYTNKNSSGTTSIKFRTLLQIVDLPTPEQINYTLQNNVSTFTDIPSLSFLNENIDSNKIIVHVSNTTQNRHGMYFLNCVLKGNEWAMNSHCIGNVQGIRFKMVSQNSLGKIQYVNTNNDGSYILRIQQIKISKSQSNITLAANTTIPSYISQFQFDNTVQSSFQLTIYVLVPDINKYALYEIEGFFCEDKWKINSRFIGDKTGIDFSITTTSGVGYLKFTNPNNVDGLIRYIKNTPLVFQPLPVNKGGTGNTLLHPFAVLRGNGTDPILGTSDFIYQDYTLVLGTSSSLLLNNPQPAINLTTGGTITTYGGVAIKKNLLVGEGLTVSGIEVTPSIGDISAERSFLALNNVIVPSNVTGFNFDDLNIKSFSGIVCVTITTDTDVLDTLYEVKGLRKKNGWILNSNYIGDNTGIKFTITNLGQVQYTSPAFTDWIATKMKFRAMTTTI